MRAVEQFAGRIDRNRVIRIEIEAPHGEIQFLGGRYVIADGSFPGISCDTCLHSRTRALHDMPGVKRLGGRITTMMEVSKQA